MTLFDIYFTVFGTIVFLYLEWLSYYLWKKTEDFFLSMAFGVTGFAIAGVICVFVYCGGPHQ